MLLEVGSLRILTDPVFGRRGASDSILGLAHYHKTNDPIACEDQLDNLDLVLLSHHHHIDNLDAEGAAIASRANTLLTTKKAAKTLGPNAKGLEPWQEFIFKGRDGAAVKITATPAQHGPAFLNWLTGPVIGFVLEWSGQQTGALYISGDTVMFSGVAEVARRFSIGTAILHVGRAHFAVTPFFDYTFSAKGAVLAAKTLGAHQVVPIHYEGWSHFRDGKVEIARAFAEANLQSKLIWLAPGVKSSIAI